MYAKPVQVLQAHVASYIASRNSVIKVYTRLEEHVNVPAHRNHHANPLLEVASMSSSVTRFWSLKILVLGPIFSEKIGPTLKMYVPLY